VKHLMYATPPTLLGGFCSYPHTVTNVTWRWPWRLDVAILHATYIHSRVNGSN